MKKEKGTEVSHANTISGRIAVRVIVQIGLVIDHIS